MASSSHWGILQTHQRMKISPAAADRIKFKQENPEKWWYYWKSYEITISETLHVLFRNNKVLKVLNFELYFIIVIDSRVFGTRYHTHHIQSNFFYDSQLGMINDPRYHWPHQDTQLLGFEIRGRLVEHRGFKVLNFKNLSIHLLTISFPVCDLSLKVGFA